MEKDDHQGGCCKGGPKEHSTKETLDGEEVTSAIESHAPFYMQSLTSREASGLLLGMGRKTGSSTFFPGFLMLPTANLSFLILVFLALIIV